MFSITISSGTLDAFNLLILRDDLILLFEDRSLLSCPPFFLSRMYDHVVLMQLGKLVVLTTKVMVRSLKLE